MFLTTETDLKQQAVQANIARFGGAPEAVAFAPGRVNLLGEHTDYNGGFVLPMPLGLGIAIAVGTGEQPGILRVASDSFEGEDTRRIDECATGAWSDYVLGSFKAVAEPEIAAQGVCAMLTGNLPVGAGLSSSAAVEVATMRAAGLLYGKQPDPVEIAKMARSVENDFIGMPCGIMDQFAISVGSPGHALFLDTRKLIHQPVPLPQGHSFVVIHSGVSHKLTDDGYAIRVAECQTASAALGVGVLSDLSLDDLDRVARLDDPLDRRARHIITENQRVLDGVEALANNDLDRFGRLMVASHTSQRDDYEVSVPEVDALVQGALAAGAKGARLTGGGFGGSIVALVADQRVAAMQAQISKTFPHAILYPGMTPSAPAAADQFEARTDA